MNTKIFFATCLFVTAAFVCAFLLNHETSGLRKHSQFTAGVWVKLKHTQSGFCLAAEKPFGTVDNAPVTDSYVYADDCKSPDVILFKFVNEGSFKYFPSSTRRFTYYWVKVGDDKASENWSLAIQVRQNNVVYRKIAKTDDNGQRWFAMSSKGKIHLRNYFNKNLILNLDKNSIHPNVISNNLQVTALEAVPDSSLFETIAA